MIFTLADERPDSGEDDERKQVERRYEGEQGVALERVKGCASR